MGINKSLVFALYNLNDKNLSTVNRRHSAPLIKRFTDENINQPTIWLDFP